MSEIYKITKTVEHIEIESIDLLTKEEFLECFDNTFALDILKKSYFWFWLKDIDTESKCPLIASIGYKNKPNIVYQESDIKGIEICPVIRFIKLNQTEYNIGEQIVFGNYNWTIIKKEPSVDFRGDTAYVALCADGFGTSIFNEYGEENLSYEKSYIKSMLEDWLLESI